MSGTNNLKSLWQVVAAVESSGNQRAMRFEAGDFASPPAWVESALPAILAAHPGFSQSTVLMIALTSWGAFQMLGANIWGGGYKKTVADFMSPTLTANGINPDQFSAFSAMLAKGGFTPSEEPATWDDARFEKFAAFWNGEAYPASYVTALKAAAE